MERLPSRAEMVESNETAYLAMIGQLELDFSAGREPNYEPVLEIVPELRALQFDFINPAYPNNDMLRHSLCAATLAEYDIVRKALPLHDIAKTLPKYQKWCQKDSVYPPISLMKFPGHELAGAEIARPILERLITDSDPYPDNMNREAKIGLMLNIIRYHDSWGDNLDRDLSGITANFDSQTMYYLFDAQQADLMAHTDEIVAKHSDRLLDSQRQIAAAILAKSSLMAQKQR